MPTRRYIVSRIAALHGDVVERAYFLRFVGDGFEWTGDLAAATTFRSFDEGLDAVRRFNILAAFDVEVRFPTNADREGGRVSSPEELRATAARVLRAAEYADRSVWSLRRIAREVLGCDPSWLSRLSREISGAAPDPAKAAAARKATAGRAKLSDSPTPGRAGDPHGHTPEEGVP